MRVGLNRVFSGPMAKIAAALGLGIASLAVTASPAHAGLLPVQGHIQNDATGRCLDDSALGLRTVPCNGTAFQQWIVYFNSEQTPPDFKNVATGNCMDLSPAGLRGFPCNGTNYQRWNTIPWGSAQEYHNIAMERCLDDSFEYGLRAIGCNGGTAWQRWRLFEG